MMYQNTFKTVYVILKFMSIFFILNYTLVFNFRLYIKTGSKKLRFMYTYIKNELFVQCL